MCESIEELKYPQDFNSNQPFVIISDDLHEKEIKNPKVHAMFRRSSPDIKQFQIQSGPLRTSEKDSSCQWKCLSHF